MICLISPNLLPCLPPFLTQIEVSNPSPWQDRVNSLALRRCLRKLFVFDVCRSLLTYTPAQFDSVI